MKRNKNRIHLIERDNRMVRLEGQLWESGYWSLPEAKAKKLPGGSIYFHKKQREPSFFGGIIVSYRLQDKGVHTGRVVFAFEFQEDHRNVVAEGRGWSQEMKVLVKD